MPAKILENCSCLTILALRPAENCFTCVPYMIPLFNMSFIYYNYSPSEDCADVCDGVFAFRSLQDAEACCRLTRSLTDNTFAPTAAPTPMGTENLRDESGGDPGTTASCRNLGGPSDTSVRVRYGEYLDQCLLCVGPTVAGDECGAPDIDATSDAAMRMSKWSVGMLSVVAGALVALGARF